MRAMIDVAVRAGLEFIGFLDIVRVVGIRGGGLFEADLRNSS